MTKKTKIMIGTVVVAVAIVATISLSGMLKSKAPVITNEDLPTTTTAPVIVEINKAIDQVEEATAEPDVDLGQESVGGLQENVPIPTKPPAPKEAPKAQGSYTNPDAPPTYTEKEIVKETVPTQKPSTSNNNQGSNSGKVYVEGFGYIEISGPNEGGTADSSGDINKIVGTMD